MRPRIHHSNYLVVLSAALSLTMFQCHESIDSKIIQQKPVMILSVLPNALWNEVHTNNSITLRYGSSDMMARIDLTDDIEDGSYAGIVFTNNMFDYAGFYAAAKTPFIIPDQATTQDTAWLTLSDSSFNITMHQGNYGQIQHSENPQIDTRPIEMNATATLSQRHVTVDISGMYYIMLPKDDTHLTIFSRHYTVIDSLFITLHTERTLRYFESVDSLLINTKKYGTFTLITDARRLQIDIPDASTPENMLFELDFDHAYKDSNQVSVRSILKFDI